ncbi:MAG TPA: hypothetical protein VNC61_06755 [Acidimicrobiales bacterium]|nr:hypothetical protein [Acidimicrobiales bacterium]
MNRNADQRTLRQSVVRVMALGLAVAMPLLGTSTIASAHSVKAAKHHHHHHPKGGGGTTGTGGGGSAITVSVEGSVVQVEASPAFAGDEVNISSSQFQASCGGTIEFVSIRTGAPVPSFNNITTVLDNDGNATVFMVNPTGNLCAPGINVVEASMTVAPFLTALTDMVTYPDVVTPPGAFAFPDPEVETGDTATSGDSDVYAEFAVETSPVYAEGFAEISDAQLASSCLRGAFWITGAGIQPANTPVVVPISDTGNAGALFFGISCAPMTSAIIADVLSHGGPTYVGSYTVLPPAPTI